MSGPRCERKVTEFKGSRNESTAFYMRSVFFFLVPRLKKQPSLLYFKYPTFISASSFY